MLGRVGKSWVKEKSLLSKNRKSWELPKGQENVYNKVVLCGWNGSPGAGGAGRAWGGTPSAGSPPGDGRPQGVGPHHLARCPRWGRRAPGGGALTSRSTVAARSLRSHTPPHRTQSRHRLWGVRCECGAVGLPLCLSAVLSFVDSLAVAATAAAAAAAATATAAAAVDPHQGHIICLTPTRDHPAHPTYPTAPQPPWWGLEIILSLHYPC